MIERDYFMRMVQILTTALVKILLKKDLKQYSQAMQDIDQIGEKLVGMKWTAFRAFSDGQMVGLLGDEETLSKMYAAAELLREESDILHLDGKESESILQAIKAFSLYTELIIKDKGFLQEIFPEKFTVLLAKIEEFELSPELELKRGRYYEIIGEFAKAEEIIDELIIHTPRLIHEARMFYARLLNIPEEELVHGGLLKNEIERKLRTLSSASIK
jgi:hypothetical protein